MYSVDEVARRLGLSRSETLRRLEALNGTSSSSDSQVDEKTLERLRSDTSGNGLAASDSQATASMPSASGPDGAEGAGRSSTRDGRVGDGGRPASHESDATSEETAAEARTGVIRIDSRSRVSGDRVSDSGEVSSAPIERTDRKRRKGGHSIVRQIAELPLLVVFAFVIAVVIKTFLVQAFYIPSGSMLPTLQVRDRVLVEKLSYLIDEPSQRDVIVFARTALPGPHPDLPWTQDLRNFLRELLGLPTAAEEDYIKRVVATGGDIIEYSGRPRVLKINGEKVEELYLKGGEDEASQAIQRKDCKRLRMERADSGCRVPADTVFVMGDNRSNSQDSRYIGPIATDKIVGRAFVTIWPPSGLGGL